MRSAEISAIKGKMLIIASWWSGCWPSEAVRWSPVTRTGSTRRWSGRELWRREQPDGHTGTETLRWNYDLAGEPGARRRLTSPGCAGGYPAAAPFFSAPSRGFRLAGARQNGQKAPRNARTSYEGRWPFVRERRGATGWSGGKDQTVA
jgi:hypothetical protein